MRCSAIRLPHRRSPATRSNAATPAILLARCKLLGLPLRRIRDELYAAALPDALGGSWLFGTRKGLGLPL
jgi:hypothetical protein